ncbi:hypothetical protein [Poriferisphaera sp. WC338]|uniref:hypothetical protein n=1 Tax=Poriferisphaera sp. WC338 TaxID=3425129 RepID=UPI003D813474
MNLSRMSRTRKMGLGLACGVLTLSATSMAIQPDAFVESTEAVFDTGTTDNTVVTNLGDIKLSAQAEVIGEMPEQASIVYDVQQVGGVVYLAAGAEAKLLKKEGDEIKTVLELESGQIFTLGEYNGKLLVGVSDETSSLSVLEDDGTLKEIAKLENVRYIWDILVRGEMIVIATGIEGRVLGIMPKDFNAEAEEGENKGLIEILDAEQVNVLCLAEDDEGLLYAGTDTDGLVYRISGVGTDKLEKFVILDAAEPEIGALLVAKNGNVYAGTADANMAKPGRMSEAEGQEKGRPSEGGETLEKIEGEAGEGENPGDLPDVAPKPEPVAEDDAVAETKDDTAATDEGDAPEAADEASNDDGPSAEAIAKEQEEIGAEVVEPTPEQRDRLRDLVREKLAAARKSGTLQAPAGTKSGKKAPNVSRAKGGNQGPQQGNAIYKIDRDGFVSQVFRESVMILKMIEDDGKLLVGTGNEGQIFRIDPTTSEVTIVSNLDAEQVPALDYTESGVLVGTANPAQLIDLTEAGKETRGTFTSAVLDAGQVSLWGTLRVTANIPDGTSVTVETRSGNVANPELAPWSEWSVAQAFMPGANESPLQPRQMVVNSPPARFVQYRVTLTGDSDNSPVVGRVELAYVTPNLRPMITSVKTSYTEPQKGQAQAESQLGQPNPNMNIEWEAHDPNGDKLLYAIQFQPSGSTAWVDVATDIEQNNFEWNTSLRSPDGWYYVRVMASDRLDNPGDMALSYTRRSEPVLVDNSAPEVQNLKIAIEGGAATLLGTAADRWSPIHGIAYVVDDDKFFTPVLPEDLIFDSTQEAFSVKLTDLPKGEHVVTLKVTDARGNYVLKRQLIDIK